MYRSKSIFVENRGEKCKKKTGDLSEVVFENRKRKEELGMIINTSGKS